MPEEKQRTYNILVYGIEKCGLTAPTDPISTRNFTLTFEPFQSDSRFNDYDGVILFQGIFEKFERKHGMIESYLAHHCDDDELDKRKKEARLLLNKGGFLCFLLNKEFIDRDGRKDFSIGDLAKFHISYDRFLRENFDQRITHLDIELDDFRPFLEIYGAANSHFKNYNEGIDWRIIAKFRSRVVGFIIDKSEFFIPSLIPGNSPQIIEEFFKLVANGLTSSFNKLQVTLPDWIEEFTFSEEKGLIEEREHLQERIHQINERRRVLSKYKAVLVYSGEDLVRHVGKVFSEGFGIPIDTEDEFREDLKLLDDEGSPICLCEVKGTNKGVKREFINQADSHRERSGLNENFPTLLIVNTNIKNAKTISEKDQDVASEQILHAVKMNILIIRTIDLLELLKAYLDNQISAEAVLDLLLNKVGWLRFKDAKYEIVQEALPN